MESNLLKNNGIINFELLLSGGNLTALDWMLLSLLFTTVSFSLISLFLYWQIGNIKKSNIKDMITIKEHLNIMSNSNIGLGNRLVVLEEKILTTENKQIALESKYPELSAFSKADNLIKSGATSDDLVNAGLNRPEADLLTFLSKQKRSVGKG